MRRSQLGYTDALGAARTTIEHALAGYIDGMGIAAVDAGQVVGDQIYSAAHRLVLHSNLFFDDVRDTQEQQAEPVLVGILSDGTVTDLSLSTPRPFSTGIVQVDVRGASSTLALACAWRLWSLFSNSAQILGNVRHGCSDPSVPDRDFLDLIIQSVRPIDEPRVVLREVNNRDHVLFRLSVRFSRLPLSR